MRIKMYIMVRALDVRLRRSRVRSAAFPLSTTLGGVAENDGHEIAGHDIERYKIARHMLFCT